MRESGGNNAFKMDNVKMELGHSAGNLTNESSDTDQQIMQRSTRPTNSL
jgi:hypothetical protein